MTESSVLRWFESDVASLAGQLPSCTPWNLEIAQLLSEQLGGVCVNFDFLLISPLALCRSSFSPWSRLSFRVDVEIPS